MVRKRLLPTFSDRISCIGLTPDESLMHLEKTILLQADEMCCQIPISHLQHLLEIIETDLLIYHEYAHHPEADAVIKNFI